MTVQDVDYAIVGAGSAGCVLAERLSADGRNRVLVLEAGGSDARFWIKVPVGYALTHTDPALNWGYRTDPDPGLAGRSIAWPRGRVLGGCSSINAMAYVRGLPDDFQAWERAGATGWGWEAVRETYDRMECRHPVTDPRTTGREAPGPVWVSDLTDRMCAFSKTFLDAGRQTDLPLSAGLNAGNGTEGLGYYRSTIRAGRRWSAADAFLRTARRRPNLALAIHADVECVTFDGARATGLRYRQHGRLKTVRVRREVILSAGAINSPKLLQLSGIGPADALKAAGIPVRRHLSEVGRGLQDHLAISYQFRASARTLNAELGTRLGRIWAGVRYLATRRGPLSVPVNQVGGFLRSSPDRDGPDVQLFCNPASYDLAPNGRPILDRGNGYLIAAQPCRPTSRGRVRIVSPDPTVAPAIEANSLATSDDRDAALRASKLLQRLAKTPALRAVTVDAKTEDLATLDDAALLDVFRARASTVFHASCTCRMGRDADDSVLNARLQVHGVAGLRVVDASAFPSITSGNTNAPTMMLAMRAADLILADAAAEG